MTLTLRRFPHLLGILLAAAACSSHDHELSAASTGELRVGSQSASATWIAPTAIHSSHLQHDSLSPAQVTRIRQLQQTFAEVDSSSAGKWIDDFRRDADPEREVRIYEGMAEAYAAYVNGRTLTLAAKRDVYQIVLLRSGAPDADVLAHLKLEQLTPDDAKEVLKLYKMPPAPITVTRDPQPEQR